MRHQSESRRIVFFFVTLSTTCAETRVCGERRTRETVCPSAQPKNAEIYERERHSFRRGTLSNDFHPHGALLFFSKGERAEFCRSAFCQLSLPSFLTVSLSQDLSTTSCIILSQLSRFHFFEVRHSSTHVGFFSCFLTSSLMLLTTCVTLLMSETATAHTFIAASLLSLLLRAAHSILLR